MEASIPAASVIVPAWNASRWIERTLATVMSQTVRDIEIIVVDDGSTDGTRGIVERLAGSDGRIRIVAQANGGVARARNLGIAHATAPLIAPVDADDLWHPRRLELHLAAFERGGERLGLVYSPYARIDEDDRVLEIPRYLFREGSVFASNVYFNLVGNGSGITIRKPILEALGGYSSFLRDRGAEGCEDRLLQMKVSHGHGFACVPLPLIGYRKSSTSMSARQVQMALSAVLALEDIRRFATAPAHHAEIHRPDPVRHQPQPALDRRRHPSTGVRRNRTMGRRRRRGHPANRDALGDGTDTPVPAPALTLPNPCAAVSVDRPRARSRRAVEVEENDHAGAQAPA